MRRIATGSISPAAWASMTANFSQCRRPERMSRSNCPLATKRSNLPRVAITCWRTFWSLRTLWKIWSPFHQVDGDKCCRNLPPDLFRPSRDGVAGAQHRSRLFAPPPPRIQTNLNHASLRTSNYPRTTAFTRCSPVAPCGTVARSSEICKAPLPSVARTAITYSPGAFGCQS